MNKLARLTNSASCEVFYMTSVGIFEAKTNLSKYISALINKEESSIVIVKNGKPVARLVPYETDAPMRIGIAEGKIPKLCELDEFNSIEVESDFYGNGGLI